MAERQHKATYTRDKKKGGYLVRVVGPHASAFAGKQVPVSRKDDSEETETLVELIWSGIDDGSYNSKDKGKPVALYSFQAHPKDENEEIAF